MMLDAPMLASFRRLELTDEQRQHVRQILITAHQRGTTGAGAAHAAGTGRQDMAAIFNPGDPRYARAVQAAKDRAAARIQQATDTQQALYNVLTPAQKTQLSQIFAQRQERRQQRRQQRGQQDDQVLGGGQQDGTAQQ